LIVNNCTAQNSSSHVVQVTQKAKLINFSKNKTNPNFEKLQFSLGLGIATYDKSSFLFSLESYAFFSEFFSISLGIDVYRILINRRSDVKAKSFNVLDVYSLPLFDSKLVNFVLGGGVALNQGFSLIGMLKLDFNLNKNISVGPEYKQPIFFGSDFQLLLYF